MFAGTHECEVSFEVG